MTRKMKELYCVKYLFLWYLKYTRRRTEDVKVQTKGGREGRGESEKMEGVVKKEGNRRRG